MVDPVDGMGTKLNPLSLDEDGGADLERHIRDELPYYRGHSGNRGRIKRLPSVVMDIEVEEFIGSGETAFRDE